MNGELCPGLLAKFIIHIILLLWQLGHEYKFQTTAQNSATPLLPEEEVSAVTRVLSSFGRLEEFQNTFSETYCKNGDDETHYEAGVYCDCSFNGNTTCHINKIVWRYRRLNGIIPKELTYLTHLIRLDLFGNQIEGEIPATFSNLSRLNYLELADNQLTGAIPKSLGNLTMLQYLNLENNFLTGPIPPSLGSISSLLRLALDRNQLNGSLPPELGKLTSLQGLYLGDNQLSGSLPPELGNTSLENLSLKENQLSGSLPPELGNLRSLETLSLQSNYITGNLPDSFAQLNDLMSFSISGNYLYGPFPEFITNWTYIHELSFHGNNFRGKIPPEIFNLSNLYSLQISDVETSPEFQFPPSANLTSIEILVLRNCSIKGPIPPYIANMSLLEYLDLSFNKLTDRIPHELEILVNLTYIQPEASQLPGLPSCYSPFIESSSVSFAENHLSGPIPAWISHAAKRTEIDLSYNDFEDSNNQDQRIPNLNLFSCCRSCKVSSNCTPEMKGVDQLNRKYCPHGELKNYSLHINSGGEEKDINGNIYDEDTSRLPYQVRNGTKNYWAFSSSGSFLSPAMNSSVYIKKAKYAIPVTEAPLFAKARIAPVSLKYYGLCLLSGSYNVTLYFSETVNTEDDAEQSYLKMKKRVFDVYIQKEPVRINFRIDGKIKGTDQKVAVIKHTAHVGQNGLLEIHLYWAGKGSSSSYQQTALNGPLISAVSVTPDFKLEVGGRKKVTGAHIAMITLSSITFALLLSLAFAWKMGWLEEESPDIKVGEDKTITLKQLIVATRGFSKDVEIGKGGFGTVYRAELPDHGIVAVKKLSTLSNEGIEKLNVGIYNLQNLRHENLVRLFDIYVGKGLCFLVYEYMENRSLADVLFDPEHKIKLNWDARFNICVGIAKGLQYLHEHPRLKMVHWGIKAANILLDSKLKPKISDLGLASASVENDNEASHFLWMMKTEASTGYMAPEYPTIGKKSGYKYDVYSFGVIMLEIVCGRKNVGVCQKNKQELELLVDEVCIADSRGKLLTLVDESLSSTYDTKQAMTILKLAMKCTHISPGVRPTMSQTVSVLANDTPLDEIFVTAPEEDEKKYCCRCGLVQVSATASL